MRHGRFSSSAALLLLAGCGSGAPPALLYSLDGPAAPASSVCQSGQWVAVPPVSLPEYADRDQLARRVAAHQILLDDTAHWAERPSVAIARLILAAIDRQPHACPSAGAPEEPMLDLRVAFHRFEFMSDGGVLATGDWRLLDRAAGATIAAGAFDRQAAADGAGTAGSIAAMNEALGVIADGIATGVAPHIK